MAKQKFTDSGKGYVELGRDEYKIPGKKRQRFTFLKKKTRGVVTSVTEHKGNNAKMDAWGEAMADMREHGTMPEDK